MKRSFVCATRGGGLSGWFCRGQLALQPGFSSPVAGSFAGLSAERRMFDIKRDIQKACASSTASLLIPGRGGVVPLAGRPKDFLRT